MLTRLARHSQFGLISFPLIGQLYVREKEIPLLPKKLGVVFRTELELAANQIRWLGSQRKFLSKPIWMAVDGFYAKKPIFQAAREQNIVIVTRIRVERSRSTTRVFLRLGQSHRGLFAL